MSEYSGSVATRSTDWDAVARRHELDREINSLRREMRHELDRLQRTIEHERTMTDIEFKRVDSWYPFKDSNRALLRFSVRLYGEMVVCLAVFALVMNALVDRS